MDSPCPRSSYPEIGGGGGDKEAPHRVAQMIAPAITYKFTHLGITDAYNLVAGLIVIKLANRAKSDMSGGVIDSMMKSPLIYRVCNVYQTASRTKYKGNGTNPSAEAVYKGSS